MKTPYLSTTLRFLLLVMASLLFSLNHTAYAEGLSGLKESLNKGKTSIKVSDDKDAKLLKTKVSSRSNKVLNASKKYDPYRMLENTKEVYIDKNNKLVKIEVNQKPMIIKVPVFSKQSRQKPKIALLRIGESPSKIPSFTSTNFEKEFPQTENTREIEAQNKIKNIRATLENELSESNFSKIITDIYKVCSDYPDISYICAMAKLY